MGVFYPFCICLYSYKDRCGMSSQKNSCDIKNLILMVRNGDQEAFVTLLEQYKPLVDASVNRFSLDESFSLYSEDLKQEAAVVFYNSILAYDLEQTEVEFGLFAKICIHNALVSQLRALKKRCAEPFEKIPENLFFAQDSEDPSVKVLEQERLKSLYAVIRKNLSDLEYTVWQMYVSGRSASEVASLLGTNEKSITNAIYRIRKKLRALLR